MKYFEYTNIKLLFAKQYEIFIPFFRKTLCISN